MTKFKNRDQQSYRFKEDKNKSSNDTYPIFCFQYNQNENYTCKALDGQKAHALLQKLDKWGKTPWAVVQSGDRKGIGHEIISSNSIKVSIPEIAKKQKILSTRFHGDCRLLGFRENSIFHILWIDHDLSVYSH